MAAVLGVEANVDYFNALALSRNNLYYAGALSALGGLVFGLLFLLYQRRLHRAEQRLMVNEAQAFLGRYLSLIL